MVEKGEGGLMARRALSPFGRNLSGLNSRAARPKATRPDYSQNSPEYNRGGEIL